ATLFPRHLLPSMVVPTGPCKALPSFRDPHQAVEENFIRNDESFIRAVKNYPSLADALIRLLQEARSQGPPAQATRFIGMTDLVCSLSPFPPPAHAVPVLCRPL
ncbi:hypothetical protein C0992_001711, partial [Termitomyces sp. T32_za158]